MLIEQYAFGRITVGGRTYTSDVVICPEGVDDGWWRRKGHELSCKDLEPVWAARPELLVIGTGAYGAMRVLPEARELMQARCAQVHILPTTQAWAKYNELLRSGQGRVVAALHLTC